HITLSLVYIAWQ
ncbi:hypothetical protein ACN38_g11579, partial [Penicillium nordicum]